MCFSMRRTDVCTVEERRILRKSAFWAGDVTEKRILQVGPHGKAHSARCASRESASCTLGLTRKRILRMSGHAECVFP